MYIRRRILETIIITLIASVPIYILTKIGFVANTNAARGIVLALGALIFYFLHLFVLKGHLIAVGKTSGYLLVNLIILAVHGMLCVITKKFISLEAYNALFGFTSMFCYLYFPRKLSVTLIYLAYLAEILFFPLDRRVQYKYYLTDEEKMKITNHK